MLSEDINPKKAERDLIIKRNGESTPSYLSRSLLCKVHIQNHTNIRVGQAFYIIFINKMIFIFVVLSLTGIGQGFKLTRPSKYDTSFFPSQNWNFIKELQDDRVKNQCLTKLKLHVFYFIYARTMCCFLQSSQPLP